MDQNVLEQNIDVMEDIIIGQVRDDDTSEPGGGMGD